MKTKFRKDYNITSRVCRFKYARFSTNHNYKYDQTIIVDYEFPSKQFYQLINFNYKPELLFNSSFILVRKNYYEFIKYIQKIDSNFLKISNIIKCDIGRNNYFESSHNKILEFIKSYDNSLNNEYKNGYLKLKDYAFSFHGLKKDIKLPVIIDLTKNGYNCPIEIGIPGYNNEHFHIAKLFKIEFNFVTFNKKDIDKALSTNEMENYINSYKDKIIDPDYIDMDTIMYNIDDEHDFLLVEECREKVIKKLGEKLF